MLQDLAALAPPAIVCAAFLVGAWVLIRRELAPKRRQGANAERRPSPGGPGEVIQAEATPAAGKRDGEAAGHQNRDAPQQRRS